jgi:hypothetical protein
LEGQMFRRGTSSSNEWRGRSIISRHYNNVEFQRVPRWCVIDNCIFLEISDDPIEPSELHIVLACGCCLNSMLCFSLAITMLPCASFFFLTLFILSRSRKMFLVFMYCGVEV